MRRILLVPALGLLAACEPVDVRFREPSGPGVTQPDTPHDPLLVPVSVEGSGPKPCAAPEARTTLGAYDTRVSDNPPASKAYLWSGGLMAGDLDSDGILDLVSPLEQHARMYRGTASATMESWDDPLAEFDLSYGTGGSLADYDGDGDLDTLVLRYDAPVVLLRNEGLGRFTDVTGPSGIDASGPTTASTWGDVDADGDLDLFIGAYGTIREGDPVSWLYENRGDGTFLDRSAHLPESVRFGYTRVAGFHDVDRDGYPELYVVNDVGSVSPNRLLRNVRGRLVPDDGKSGLDLEMSGGGLGVGDVNGDGLPDFLIPQWDDLSLMLSGEDGRWFDSALDRGLVPAADQCVGWGAELADLDNDGDLDGIVAYGQFDVPDWSENPEVQPDGLFLQDDDGSFVDAAAQFGLDEPGTGRGFVVADFNDDGWLDLVKRELEGPSRLHLSRCGADHWLQVELADDRVMNRFAVGASVEVTTDEGRTFTRWVSAGGTGFGSGGPPVLHFGLGAADHVVQIEVRWPDGARSVVGGAEVDQKLVLRRTL